MPKTWLVTGSSIGLGRAIVEAVLAGGDNVVATARDTSALDDLSDVHGARIRLVKHDVRNANAAIEAVRAANEAFGRLDIAVNNAGFAGLGSVENIPIELIEDQFAVNFMGAVHLCRAALPSMRVRRKGRIVLVSSIGARIATAGAAIYYSSKAALSSLAQSLALEVAPLGIQVTAVEPGALRTRFADQGSLKVSSFDAAYDSTVGATESMMQTPQYKAILRDPAAVAGAIVRLALLDHPPVRLLLGEDAFAMGVKSYSDQAESDLRWEALSRSPGGLIASADAPLP
jgi:NAD(P)-dependent dehydrogenase (short-subunit alcohol dehydrogenase family)